MRHRALIVAACLCGIACVAMWAASVPALDSSPDDSLSASDVPLRTIQVAGEDDAATAPWLDELYRGENDVRFVDSRGKTIAKTVSAKGRLTGFPLAYLKHRAKGSVEESRKDQFRWLARISEDPSVANMIQEAAADAAVGLAEAAAQLIQDGKYVVIEAGQPSPPLSDDFGSISFQGILVDGKDHIVVVPIRRDDHARYRQAHRRMKELKRYRDDEIVDRINSLPARQRVVQIKEQAELKARIAALRRIDEPTRAQVAEWQSLARKLWPNTILLSPGGLTVRRAR